MKTSSILINKFRPVSFDEVLGNQLVIKALKGAVRSESRPHTYLFTGPAGVGKTSLGRIIGTEVGATPIEIDAASYGSVDDMRRLVEGAVYKPLDGKNRIYIIDEVHAIGSKQAWSALLKITEEPPPFLFFALCTTESQKVPNTIVTRAYNVVLRPLKRNEIEDLISTVCEIEGWVVGNDVFSAIIGASQGSPRRALTILQAGHELKSRDELSQVIATVDSDASPIIQLCNYLLKHPDGATWKPISAYLEAIDDEGEAIEVAARYLSSCMVRSDERQAIQIWHLLESFTMQSGWDKRVQLVSAMGRIVFGKPPF